MRRDRRGRRIGRNWWREYVVDTLRCADHAWSLAAEAASCGWATELAEWRVTNPRPTLKACLVELASKRHLEVAA